MTQQEIDMYIINNAKYFPQKALKLVQEKLNSIPDEKKLFLQTIEYKNPTTMLILSIFFGHLGVDRFIMKETPMGLLKLFLWLIPYVSYIIFPILYYSSAQVSFELIWIPCVILSLFSIANLVLTAIDWFTIQKKVCLDNFNKLMQFEI